MELTDQKCLQRVISQKAMQMSNKTSCKIWVLGFFCGVCITNLFLVALAPFRTREFGMVYQSARRVMPENSVLPHLGANEKESENSRDPESITLKSIQKVAELSDHERVLKLYTAWSAKLNEDGKNESSTSGPDGFDIPHAPHIEDCRLNAQMNKQFDTRSEDGNLPPWTLWRGLLGLKLLQPTLVNDTEKTQFIHEAKLEGAYPPWVRGSDADNYPLTREVQRDLWIHQHPQNCHDPELRFLIADWERFPGYGFGAQLAEMAGLLAIAANEKRILVTNYYNRADHRGCQGSSHSRWSCYFLPETSSECQKRVFDLMENKEAWRNRTITSRDNYTSKEIWAGRVPRAWRRPWSMLQPTTEIDGSLLMSHRKMERRWWRAQAIRYLMRFQSEYTCHLLNVARHEAFGMEAAKMVVDSNLLLTLQKVSGSRSEVDLERIVWSDHKPWTPRPLLSMHVRMGDKACEMKVVGFENYMQLASRVRERFRNLNSIWLSTEMQEVIDQTRSYPHWKFYYTNIARQVGNMSMFEYEASLGRETSTNYPLVNFLMATEADFFIGALGSTWCYMIDGMRNTGGKVMSGYLSVNKDRSSSIFIARLSIFCT